MKVVLLFVFSMLVSAARAQDSLQLQHDTVAFSHMDFDTFRLQARFENKPYFIMFSASWCAPCQRLKKEIFTNPQIAALANQHWLAYYMDLENFDDVEINSKLYKVEQLPTILFFDPLGKQTDKAVGFFDGYYFFRKLRVHIPPYQWGPDWIEE